MPCTPWPDTTNTKAVTMSRTRIPSQGATASGMEVVFGRNAQRRTVARLACSCALTYRATTSPARMSAYMARTESLVKIHMMTSKLRRRLEKGRVRGLALSISGSQRVAHDDEDRQRVEGQEDRPF